jgi:hypothetical protein
MTHPVPIPPRLFPVVIRDSPGSRERVGTGANPRTVAPSASSSPPIPNAVVNPRTKETFVLVRVDEYERLKEDENDDSPWTREELQALAWEVAERTDWDDCDEAPEKP